jgi:transcriptional regulator with XRE-family HTH domain
MPICTQKTLSSPMTPDDLKSLRSRLGLTQRALGEKMGLSQGWVSCRERGERGITEVEALRIRRAVGEGPPPPTGNDLRELREKLDLSYTAFAPLVGRSPQSVRRYEGENPKRASASDYLPEEVAIAFQAPQGEETPLSAQRYAELTGQRVLPDLTEKHASEKAGEEVRLLPFSSDPENLTRSLYGIGKSGDAYTFRASGFTVVQGQRVGGEWRCEKRSTKNGQLSFRIDGQDTGMSHQRAVALAWTEGPPFDGAEAYIPNEEEPPHAENVAWRSPHKRWQEYVDTTKNRQNGRPDTNVYVSNAVAHEIRKTRSQEVREHGITYVIDCLLREKLGLPKAPTPHERKTGRQPDTKAARVLLAARRHPEKSASELAELANTTPAYAQRVIDDSATTLTELRRRKKRAQVIEESRRKNRNRNIAHDAKSGLFTRSELAEKYDLSGQHIQSILNEAGVSLAEAKREREKETHAKYQE